MKDSNDKIKITALENIDDNVSVTAFGYIERIISSKIDTFLDLIKRIPIFYRYAMLITIIILAVFSGLCYINRITIDTYTNIFIALIIALMIQIGIQLKDEISLKKADEFDL